MRASASLAAAVAAFALAGALVSGGGTSTPAAAPPSLVTLAGQPGPVVLTVGAAGKLSIAKARKPRKCRAIKVRKGRAAALKARACQPRKPVVIHPETRPPTSPDPVLAPTGTVPDAAPAAPAGADESTGEYRFFVLNADGTPGRWDPCQPITWRFNPTYAPSTALADVTSALGRIAAATQASGTPLSFSYAGTTTDRAFTSSAHDDGEDLVVSFGTPAEYPDKLTGNVVGYGGARSQARVVNGAQGPWEHVSGDVLFNAQATMPSGFGGGATFGALALHEAAHAMGLDHVDAVREIMYPALTQSTPAGLGAGDATGLLRLTENGCFTQPIR